MANAQTGNATSMEGKTVVITGANSGLGLEATRALAAAGAHVVMACRNADKAQATREALLRSVPLAALEVMPLDLTHLDSVRQFASALLQRHPKLHVLINNAGIMAVPRAVTAQGFEMQLGTNHLGPFLLTALLLPALLRVEAGRVVTVSSFMHWLGTMNFEDLQSQRRYNPSGAYCQSKLANLLFALELQRKFTAMKCNTLSVACHPGYAATGLQHVGPRLEGNAVKAWAMRLGNALLAQPAHSGAHPLVHAASAPEVVGGDFLGPVGVVRGRTARVRMSQSAHNEVTAQKLWQVSQDLTGAEYSFAPA